jgi:hypothetical protein
MIEVMSILCVVGVGECWLLICLWVDLFMGLFVYGLICLWVYLFMGLFVYGLICL